MSVPPPPSPDHACPCGSGLDYAQCCEPFLDGAAAPTPEALMRSRYTAFARGDEDHIFRTWHPRTRPPGPFVDPEIAWTGLRVLGSGTVGPVADSGWVRYVATWMHTDGRTGAVRELANFKKRGNRWYYLDGRDLDA